MTVTPHAKSVFAHPCVGRSLFLLATTCFLAALMASWASARYELSSFKTETKPRNYIAVCPVFVAERTPGQPVNVNLGVVHPRPPHDGDDDHDEDHPHPHPHPRPHPRPPHDGDDDDDEDHPHQWLRHAYESPAVTTADVHAALGACAMVGLVRALLSSPLVLCGWSKGLPHAIIVGVTSALMVVHGVLLGGAFVAGVFVVDNKHFYVALAVLIIGMAQWIFAVLHSRLPVYLEKLEKLEGDSAVIAGVVVEDIAKLPA